MVNGHRQELSTVLARHTGKSLNCIYSSFSYPGHLQLQLYKFFQEQFANIINGSKTRISKPRCFTRLNLLPATQLLLGVSVAQTVSARAQCNGPGVSPSYGRCEFKSSVCWLPPVVYGYVISTLRMVMGSPRHCLVFSHCW